MANIQDPFTELSLAEQSQVNALCDRFEEALNQGKRPSLDEYLAGTRGLLRDALVRELLVLECEQVLSQGGELDLHRLQERFPDKGSIVREAMELAQRNLAVQAVLGKQTDTPLPGLGPLHFPEKFGKYRLLGAVGQGAFGIVFHGVDEENSQEVAVKVPHLIALLREDLRARFFREARATQALNHPGVVKVLEAGEVGSICFIASEFVPGATLADLLRDHTQRQERLPFRICALLVMRLAEAVQHAHQRGVFHHDLKPANVILRESKTNQPVITDFGLARMVNDRTTVTATGQVLGTPAYMAPEQVFGRRGEPGASPDVYALGGILYELLTGRPPFLGPPLEVLELKRYEAPVRPGAFSRQLPYDLETICLKCLENDPRRRYLTAQALAEDLCHWLAGERIKAKRPGPVSVFLRWRRRRPVVAGLLGLLLVVVVSGMATVLALWREAARLRDEALVSLEKEAVTRKEAEALYRYLQEMFEISVDLRIPGSMFGRGLDPVRESWLEAMTSRFASLPQVRQRNPQLQRLLAVVYTQLGFYRMRQCRDREAQAYLERAVQIWEGALAKEMHVPANRVWRSLTHAFLVRLYERLGMPREQQYSFEKVFRLWQSLTQEPLEPVTEFIQEFAVLDIGVVLISDWITGGDEKHRLKSLRAEVARIAPGVEGELFVDLAEVGWHHYQLDAAYFDNQHPIPQEHTQAAATTVQRLLRQPRFPPNIRIQVACIAVVIGKDLRRHKLPQKALQLVSQAAQVLEQSYPEAANKLGILEAQGSAWAEMAKSHYILGHIEETLTACRNALEKQKQVYAQATDQINGVSKVDWRYIQLGRKFCELGRLDEAETYFRERQKLYPQDTARQMEVIYQLRKWASQVGDGGKPLTQKERQEREYYLRLAARLEKEPGT